MMIVEWQVELMQTPAPSAAQGAEGSHLAPTLTAGEQSASL